MEKETILKINKVVTLENYADFVKICNDIINSSKSILTNYMNIGRKLKLIKDKQLYKLDGYTNFYEFVEYKFGYKETNTKNLIAVYDKYKAKGSEDSYYVEIKEPYKEYSYTALVELLPVPEKEIKENYKPDMNVKTIREVKMASQLTDQLKIYVDKYKHVIKLLTSEVDNFNKMYGKSYIKYKVDYNDLNIETYYMSSSFKFDWIEFNIKSSVRDPLSVDYKKAFDLSDEEIVKIFNERFLNRLPKEIDEKNKRKEEEKKIKEKQKKEKTVYSYEILHDGKAYMYIIAGYLQNLILKRYSYDFTSVFFKYYLDTEEYHFPLTYDKKIIGYLVLSEKDKYIQIRIEDEKANFFNEKYHFEFDKLYSVIHTLGVSLNKYINDISNNSSNEEPINV